MKLGFLLLISFISTSSSPELLLQEAQNLIALSKYEAAISKLYQLIRQYPDNLQAYYLLTKALSKASLHRQAFASCLFLVSLSPTVRNYLLCADTLLRAKLYLPAEDYVRKALDTDQSFYPAYYYLGLINLYKGRVTKGYLSLRVFVTHYTDTSDPRYTKALYLMSLVKDKIKPSVRKVLKKRKRRRRNINDNYNMFFED